ncbi:cupin domain-containing protein, partial [Salmonella sp. SAL4457]|uniref:cupin domain-containing protein n=1 Tax=Salmonella sp. SAL4457 TaxID=3159912 RepID=UPI003979E29B
RWGTADLNGRNFHPTPFAQFVVYLQGVMSITTTDGETRQFGAGDVLRVEDTAPCKGHISVVGDRASFAAISR